MTLWRLAVRGLRFHARANVGVVLGALLGTAILVGALAVGDSVRYSLRQMALSRLGDVSLALHSPARFFRVALAGEIAPEMGGAPVAPIILLPGTATGQRLDGSGDDVRVGRVQVLGVTNGFWRLGNARSPLGADTEEAVVLNDRLARALSVKIGDDVLLRVNKPSLLSRDAPLSTIEDATITLRLPVAAIVTEANFGRFSLDANQVPPHNAFVPLETLQRAVGMAGRANTLLVGGGAKKSVALADANRALWRHWRLADAGLRLHELPRQNVVELRTDRVFLDTPVGQAASRALPGARGVLTYFVNELRVGDRAAPYSTVAALDGGPLVPNDMGDDEVLINRWLADDVGAKPGDALKISYYLVGPMRRLEQHSSTFRVRAILPMSGPAHDPDLMPDIPGLSDKKDCRDWEPGVPINLDRIRDKDQAYWDTYRGTPKAFLTLRAGQRIWNSRFGDLTAVRYPVTTPGASASVDACVRQALNPASLGLFFSPVREKALAASTPSLDFGQLFLGFSFFLVVAALLLTTLLFAFGAEQRAEEVGTLLAVGVAPARVQRLFLLEGAVLALIAALLGAGLATLYTRALIAGLSTVWSGAVADAPLRYHAEPSTLAVGALAGFGMSLLAIWLVTRRQARVPARELLNAGAESSSRLFSASGNGRRLPGLPTAVVAFVLALLALVGGAQAGTGAAGAFFAAGTLLLIGGVAACRALLARWERGAATGETSLTLDALGVRNAVRRPGRSLGAIALFACGSFLVVAVGANRHDPQENARERAAGTGGFALFGEATLPVYQNLNTDEGREAFGLDSNVLAGANIVALRLREGDEASCLNLNRAQTPRLLGVNPDALGERGAFTFAQKTRGWKDSHPWKRLTGVERDGTIPVVGDTNTVVWSLGKKLGDTLDYVDDRGETHRLRIVGVLANSVLQGGLILSEDNFTRLFPSQSGYQIFLVDAPAASEKAISAELTRGLEDVGLSIAPAWDRLAAFNTVENTYLSIFAVLGGLGLLVGSLGLGVIVLRNVLERRGELALLRAVGLRARALRRLVFGEHALLLALGLFVGVASALIAVLPALRSPGANVPYLSLAVTLLAVLVSGLAWTWAATALALRARLLAALRNE